MSANETDYSNTRGCARALVRRLQEALASSERECDRLRHGVAIETDFICPDSLRADIAEDKIERIRKLANEAVCDVCAADILDILDEP